MKTAAILESFVKGEGKSIVPLLVTRRFGSSISGIRGIGLNWRLVGIVGLNLHWTLLAGWRSIIISVGILDVKGACCCLYISKWHPVIGV